jgi:hypothetical protein
LLLLTGRYLLLIACLGLTSTGAFAQATQEPFDLPSAGAGKDVVGSTPQALVNKMLDMAKVTLAHPFDRDPATSHGHYGGEARRQSDGD